MRALGWIGLIVLLLGIASLFIAIPHREAHGVKAGDVSIGVQTTESRKVPTIVSAVLIIAGAGLMVAGRGSTSAA
jgi:hypothetical protein